MTDPRTPRTPNVARPRRTQRRTAALVAQYIHELSGRNGNGRARPVAPRPVALTALAPSPGA
jgi:hypothetical protein